MEREIANIDEFQVNENGIPLFPAGLKEEANLYVLPDGRYLPCGVYRAADGGSLIYEPSELSFFGQMFAQFKESWRLDCPLDRHHSKKGSDIPRRDL